MRNLKPLLLLILALMLALIPNATAATSSFTTGFCSGNANGGGVIPANSVLSGQTQGEQGLINVSLLIMLTMLFIVAIIYMISYVLNLDLLRNIAKGEIGEVIITGIIVLVFIGTFNIAAASVNSNNVVHIAGSSFGRNLYTDDCAYLGAASLDLIPPYLSLNVIRLVVGTITSLNVVIAPAFFGFEVKPFQGYALFDTVLGILDDMIGIFIALILAVVVLMGFIYGLFPLFLYAGIILRTLPWTRAAGGAFLGLFIGFYVLFPILLHMMLTGYIGGLPTSSVTTSSNNVIGSLLTTTTSKQSSATQIITQISNFITSSYVFSSGGGSVGLVNYYLTNVVEPAAFTIVSIVISFIIAFDFADIAGDILGAPSLSAGSIMSKYI
jgi:hypothetical protein